MIADWNGFCVLGEYLYQNIGFSELTRTMPKRVEHIYCILGRSMISWLLGFLPGGTGASIFAQGRKRRVKMASTHYVAWVRGVHSTRLFVYIL
jgi:hypothetical protein